MPTKLCSLQFRPLSTLVLSLCSAREVVPWEGQPPSSYRWGSLLPSPSPRPSPPLSSQHNNNTLCQMFSASHFGSEWHYTCHQLHTLLATPTHWMHRTVNTTCTPVCTLWHCMYRLLCVQHRHPMHCIAIYTAMGTCINPPPIHDTVARDFQSS